MKEGYIESTCISMAKKAGYEYRKVKFISSSGAPDRLFYKPGHLFWCEFKTENGKVSALQKWQQNLLKDAGEEVHNIYSIEEFKEILK